MTLSCLYNRVTYEMLKTRNWPIHVEAISVKELGKPGKPTG